MQHVLNFYTKRECFGFEKVEMKQGKNACEKVKKDQMKDIQRHLTCKPIYDDTNQPKQLGIYERRDHHN